MKLKTALFSLSMLLIIASGVFIYQYDTRTEERLLKDLGLDQLDVIEMVNQLDHRLDEPANFSASISSTTLTLYDNELVYEYELPSDLFYLSFAPYLTSTHPCATHNLVSCRGELVNKDFMITITKDDGTVIVSESMRSMDNGFIGLWLPKDISASLQIDYLDRSVSVPLSTTNDSNTCLTSPLKLLPQVS